MSRATSTIRDECSLRSYVSIIPGTYSPTHFVRRTRTPGGLHVEQEVDDIAVLHNVSFALAKKGIGSAQCGYVATVIM